jgi:hypothetical protein
VRDTGPLLRPKEALRPLDVHLARSDEARGAVDDRLDTLHGSLQPLARGQVPPDPAVSPAPAEGPDLASGGPQAVHYRIPSEPVPPVTINLCPFIPTTPPLQLLLRESAVSPRARLRFRMSLYLADELERHPRYNSPDQHAEHQFGLRVAPEDRPRPPHERYQ